jgi:hypothetical protein
VGLAAGRANPIARTAADAGALIVQNHNLSFDFIVRVIVKVDEFALLVDAFQSHDILTAHLETAATADALLGIDRG